MIEAKKSDGDDFIATNNVLSIDSSLKFSCRVMDEIYLATTSNWAQIAKLDRDF